MPKTECPCCHGEKRLAVWSDHPFINEPGFEGAPMTFEGWFKCTHCMGEGIIDIEVEK